MYTCTQTHIHTQIKTRKYKTSLDKMYTIMHSVSLFMHACLCVCVPVCVAVETRGCHWVSFCYSHFIIILELNHYVCIWLLHICVWALGGQRPQTWLDWELEAVVSPLIQVLGTGFWSFARRTVPALNCWSMSLALHLIFVDRIFHAT